MRRANFDALAFTEMPLYTIPQHLVIPIFCLSISGIIVKWAGQYPQLHSIGRVWLDEAKRYTTTLGWGTE